MSVKNLEFRQHLPIDIKTAWNFFSDPLNLSKLTPAEMKFIQHTDTKGKPTYAGQIISYSVSPMLNVPMNWLTEITHVNEPFFFVDEQRKGPYKMWHHQHHFKEVKDGVEMIDILHYEIPFGFLGTILDKLFIQKKVRQIFEYRAIALEKMFY